MTQVRNNERGRSNGRANLVVNMAGSLFFLQGPQFETGGLSGRFKAISQDLLKQWLIELHGHKCHAAVGCFLLEVCIPCPPVYGEPDR